MKINITELSRQNVIEMFAKMTGTSIEEITLESNLNELFYGNVFKLGLVLYDIHEITGMNVDYSDDDIENKFQTIQDILDYFSIN